MESIDKIREQFDKAPYPRVPLDKSPKEDYNSLFTHCLTTSHYLRHHRVFDTEGAVILDAGCGSGYKSLILAEANPGARIVGIDLSEESVKLAQKRLEFHGFDNVEFHAMLVEDLPRLGMQFDYINCDEVLYLLPDAAEGLKAMKSVLKPTGLIRTNLHSQLQRQVFYHAQEFFRLIGLMDQNPREEELAIVTATMKALKPDVVIKSNTWGPQYEKPESEGMLLSNHLLLGDKGFSIPQVFDLLDQTNLDFVSMVNWRHWEVADLFKEPDNLPVLWGMSLMEADIRDRLTLYELMNPVNRLLDFWCAHPAEGDAPLPLAGWESSDWQGAIAHLHPLLRRSTIREEAMNCIQASKSFNFTKYIDLPALGQVELDRMELAVLLPLWDGPQPFQTLAERYQTLLPINPITLQPLTLADAQASVQSLLSKLEVFLYVLVER